MHTEYCSKTEDRILHHCKKAPPNFSLYPLVDEYAVAWGIEAVDLTRACTSTCGKNGSGVPDEFLVPSGMPYTVLESKKYGISFCTPFYSVIPALISPSQRSIFCVGRLTLNKVISNAAFRHELMFNPDLQLEPPAVKPATPAGKLWENVEYECRILLESPSLPRPPIVALPSILEGTKALLMNVLPASLMSQILHLFDPQRLIQTSEDSSSLKEILSFTISALEEAVLPQRMRWIGIICQHFDLLDESKTLEEYSRHLVQGLRITVALLSMTKLDQINGQIRQRVPLLLKTVVPVERAHIEYMMSAHPSPRCPRDWIINQYTVEELQVQLNEISPKFCVPSFPSRVQYKTWKLLSRLVVGFIWRLRSSEPINSELPATFDLDSERIQRLRAEICRYVLDKIRRQTSILSRRSSRYKVCLPGWLEKNLVPTSNVYKIVEKKLFWHLICDVYCIIVPQNLGYEPLPACKQLPPTAEIVRLLQLHWTVSRPTYEI